MSNNKGHVYLICFDKKFYHCKHYIGFCYDDVEARLARHRAGHGARLLRAVNLAGIGYHVVKVWHDVDKHFERRLKNYRKSKSFCPCCGDGKDIKR